MHKIKFIARKEFYHILRDPRSLAIVFLMPLLMTFLYGYAINLDIENITIAIVDFDQTEKSQELIDRFYNSTYFSPPKHQIDYKEPIKILEASNASAVLIIKPGFSSDLTSGRKHSLGMIIDGSDNNMASAVNNYTQTLVNKFLIDQLPLDKKLPRIELSQQILYNPDLKSSHFFVPGLVAIILMMISALLTSITIAREKETGTMEQLLTAPVTPHQIILGKILPYILIAFIDGFIILLFAKLLFGVPFEGSHILLILFGLIYVSTALAVGILISSVVKTQQVAMMFALVSTLLPSVMLSGFIFAIKNMPFVLQLLSNIIAAKYFIVIIRGIMLKGAGLEMLVMQSIYLIILMTILILIAAKKFTTRIA